jgi:threonine 3-dehydrogenase
MQALRKVAPEPGLVLEELPEPLPASGEVVVEVEAASICGTDLHIEQWDEWASHRIHPPLTLGHEFAGTVVEVGAAAHDVAAGDYVSAESHITCGMCFHCRTGQAHMCERTQILGVDRDGAFARYVAVPESVIWRNDRSKLPPEIATLQEPFGNAVFATSEQDLAGRSVAVLGCGPVGLFTIAIARASGAAAVLAADLRPFRLALAETMGASDTVNAAETPDAPAWFREHHGGYGFDVVFEMSGSPRAIQDAFRIARNGGRVILFGIPSRPVEIDVAEQLIFKNLDVLAVSGRRIFATWYKTRWLLESGLVDLRPLITHECGLEDFAEAMSALEAGEACKIVVYPNGTPSRAPAFAPEREPVAAEPGPARWAHR